MKRNRNCIESTRTTAARRVSTRIYIPTIYHNRVSSGLQGGATRFSSFVDREMTRKMYLKKKPKTEREKIRQRIRRDRDLQVKPFYKTIDYKNSRHGGDINNFSQ